MTDLLSAEDIKKALGAFAGEQRPCPLPSPSTPTPHPPPGPGALCPRIPSGARGGGDGGGKGDPRRAGVSVSQTVRAGLGSVGKP